MSTEGLERKHFDKIEEVCPPEECVHVTPLDKKLATYRKKTYMYP